MLASYLRGEDWAASFPFSLDLFRRMLFFCDQLRSNSFKAQLVKKYARPNITIDNIAGILEILNLREKMKKSDKNDQ